MRAAARAAARALAPAALLGFASATAAAADGAPAAPPARSWWEAASASTTDAAASAAAAARGAASAAAPAAAAVAGAAGAAARVAARLGAFSARHRVVGGEPAPAAAAALAARGFARGADGAWARRDAVALAVRLPSFADGAPADAAEEYLFFATLHDGAGAGGAGAGAGAGGAMAPGAGASAGGAAAAPGAGGGGAPALTVELQMLHPASGFASAPLALPARFPTPVGIPGLALDVGAASAGLLVSGFASRAPDGALSATFELFVGVQVANFGIPNANVRVATLGPFVVRRGR